MAFVKYTTGEGAVVVSALQSNGTTGLTSVEVSARLQRYGLNQIKTETVHWWHLLGRQFKSSFVYLLLGAAALALVLGEYIDGGMIIIFILADAILGFYQEFRSEQTSRLLEKYVVASAKVIRQGKTIIIEQPQLVPGDIVIIEAGDIIPADLRFIETHDVTVDESVLTGESVPVSKDHTPAAAPVAEIYQARNIGFSGTHSVSGRAVGVVFATGSATTIGEVAKLTIETVRVSSFEKGINTFSNFILKMVIVTLVCVVAVNWFIKGDQFNVTEMLIFAVALAVGVIPEALPVVTTFSLSRGALRLAKNKVVIKRLSAIEDLGGIDVLCTDKTGTITENSLKVAEVFSEHARQTIFLSNVAGTAMHADTIKQPNNAFDLALWNDLSTTDQAKLQTYHRVAEIPFDPERKRNSVLIERSGQQQLIVRGAAEVIMPFCTTLAIDTKHTLEQWLTTEGEQGRRTVVLATKTMAGAADYDVAEETSALVFVGAMSFSDPIKVSTANAITQARKLGVQVKILTGDGPAVAGAVGKSIGLISNFTEVITGAELEQVPAEQRLQRAMACHVFARVSPQQKYKIIQLLQTKQQVGFLGEGINDAPALKLANVSLVVQGASDIARSAADVILLQQSLAVIIDGIKEGRAVFANTIKYIQATLSSNFGNFYAVAIVSLFIDFLPMLPLQILLLNLLSDFPMIAIAADRVDAEELLNPRGYQVKDILLLATLLGIISTVFDFIFFALFRQASPAVLQTNWFIGSILTELVFLFSIRSHRLVFKATRPATIVIVLSVAAAVLTVIIPYTALGQALFQFQAPTRYDLGLILGVVALYFCITETIKLIYYRNRVIV